MDKEMQESLDQVKLVKESKDYFSKKLTKEDIYVVVSEITHAFWVRTDEKLRVMIFKQSDNREFEVGLWNETIFDVISELMADSYQSAFRAGQVDKIYDIKKLLEIK